MLLGRGDAIMAAGGQRESGVAEVEARPAVVARGLMKRYGERVVVDGVDLDIRSGECFGLLGPNGAGKTTTLRILMGLTPPSAGTLEVLGLPVPERAREMRRRAGVVPQFDNLDPDFTVRENLVTYGSYFGLGRAALAARIDQLLDYAQLADRADAAIDALSGGMKRRLTLARALINDPALIVLDEPTTGLDPQARQHIWERLRRLLTQGRTLILTTHYMEEAERLCDRAAIMDHGRIVACDTPVELIRRHIEPHVLELRAQEADAWLREPHRLQGVRVEHVGETVLLYGRDRELLLQAAGVQHFIQRPANLEDVFLKLTGRELRD
jgi:lipooligosaccharide transport system ATP-binding protein